MDQVTCGQCQSGTLKRRLVSRGGGAGQWLGLLLMLLATAGVVYGGFNLFITLRGTNETGQDVEAEVRSILADAGIPDDLTEQIFVEGDEETTELAGLSAEQQALFGEQRLRYLSTNLGLDFYQAMSGGLYFLITGLGLVTGLTGWLLTRRRVFRCSSCGALFDSI